VSVIEIRVLHRHSAVPILSYLIPKWISRALLKWHSCSFDYLRTYVRL
jgi:hypothetical protein